jgi:hypothetical protein
MRILLYNEIKNEKPNSSALGAFNAVAGIAVSIDKGFYIRDTLVTPEKFNSLELSSKNELLSIKSEQERSGYIDARTAIGPDQARRMSEKQRDKIAKKASETFKRENRVKDILKTKSEKYSERKQSLKKKLEGRLTQLKNQESYFKEGGALFKKASSKRENSTKVFQRQTTIEIQSVEKALNKLSKL